MVFFKSTVSEENKSKSKPLIDELQNLNRVHTPLSLELIENLQKIQSIYENCLYVVFHNFLISGKTSAVLIYIEGLSDTEMIDEYVLTPLMQGTSVESYNAKTIIQQKISLSNQKELTTVEEVIEQISEGNPVLLIDKEQQAVALGLAKWDKRAIAEPIAEPVIRGSREGFTETLSVNISLLLRRIKSPLLKMNSLKIGRYTQTQVIISYIDGLADPNLVQEVMSRIERVDIDGVLESGYIEEMIEDNPFSPFPQFLTTERPDVVSAQLLEGRVAILVDGTPISIIAPVTFFSLLQSSEDYYQRFMVGTAIRWLRYFFVGIALLAPSAYVSILTYHQEMVPTTLLLSIAKSREEIPFPAFFEALIMEVTFEALREAGIRLPKQVGAAVSIVGALVIGQAATAAGLVSSPMVMVVAITGVASFMIPHFSVGISIRLLRFPIMIMAGLLGFLGLILSVITIVIHLSTLRSYGVPYLSPLAPMKARDMKDVLVRAPWWMLNTRPHLTGKGNKYRQSSVQKSGPTKRDETD
ncbi:spore germination protein [Paenibacillus sp. WC2504]|uniref:spore germination protein n=1 Tax=Paenibacillus sp. WC2504 TaxID=3461403 RepID=UPI0040454293